jgi:hypothetical protein
MTKARDLGDNAQNTKPKVVDAKGDLIVGTGADAAGRLAVASTAGYLLSVDSAEATGLKWAAPASGSTYAGVSVRKSANQAITNNTDTAITWNTENFDTDAYHDNSSNTSRFTIPAGKAGKYLLSGAISWGAATGTIRSVKIFKNGSILNQLAQFAGTNDGAISAISNVYDLAVNDYLEVYARQNSGNDLDVQSGTQQSTVQLSYLGA